MEQAGKTAFYHLPGLFEFYELYRVFLPLFRQHREYFYDWCEIGSIYGAPGDCLWGGGRVGYGDCAPRDVLRLTREYGVSARLTFSNSLLREEHLSDRKCNELCRLFAEAGGPANGVIVHSDLLLHYLEKRYPGLYFVSSTTKVLTEFQQLRQELEREEFRYVVSDFRLNRAFDRLEALPAPLERQGGISVQRMLLVRLQGQKGAATRPSAGKVWERTGRSIAAPPRTRRAGIAFPRRWTNPGFIGVGDISNVYLPMGFSHFKIEGRSLGSALILEFLLYYLTKPEYQLRVREEIYLDNMLDLF